MNVHLGFEVGTGKPVEIPLAHTFIAGQTQNSGKTSTLRAIVERANQPALAFITKRGENLPGRRIPPFLPRQSKEPIPWRLVETILASALGQKQMKYERIWIVNASKAAFSLEAVRDNVTRLQAKARGGAADAYMLIGEYLDLVLPEMQALGAVDHLNLRPGLNVIDLTSVSSQLQSLVIRACLEFINKNLSGTLTVIPEAWEFIPQGRTAPAKDEAIAMARKGAAPGVRNFILIDSQNISGVTTEVRQAASVWVLGVQRELNELKRTLQMIPAGIKKPKAEDITQLEVGQFFACWERHAVKVYVQPPWLSADEAKAVALGSAKAPPEPRVEKKEDDMSEEWKQEIASNLDRLIEGQAQMRDAFRKLTTMVEEHGMALRSHAQRINAIDERTSGMIRLGPDPADYAPDPQDVDRLVESAREARAISHVSSTGGVPAPKVQPKYLDHSPDYLDKSNQNGEFEMADFDKFYALTVERLRTDQAFISSILAHVPAGGTLKLEPREVVLKEFQRAEVARILESAQGFTAWQKQVVRFLEAKGTALQKGSIVTAITGRKTVNMPRDFKDEYSGIDDLARLGFVRKHDKLGIYPNLREAVTSRLEVHGVSKEEVEEIVGQVILAMGRESTNGSPNA